MREEALRQARAAFAEDRKEIFCAMEVIIGVLEYAKKRGLLALSQDKLFREKGEAHILDDMERTGKNVPLKKYLSYALDCISFGDCEPEILIGVMENKYYVSDYVGKEAYVSYLYLTGVIGIVQGLSFWNMLERFRSIIPDAEGAAFDAFAARCERKIDEKKVKATGRIIRFGKNTN